MLGQDYDRFVRATWTPNPTTEETGAMKLTIHAEVEVDVAAWCAEYGTSGSANDVEDYLFGAWASSPAAEAGTFVITGYAVHPKN